MPATVVAIANLKGGVGKSTTTVMLADGLSCLSGRRVLVVDLDPQASSSQMLLTESGVNAAFARSQGVFQLLATTDDVAQPDARILTVPATGLLSGPTTGDPSPAASVGRLFVCPSHPLVRLRELSIEEDWYGRGAHPHGLSEWIQHRMERFLSPLKDDFDLILLDCPPNLSLLARAGLECADAYVTPLMADSVCLWGARQFADWVSLKIDPGFRQRQFVVITRFRNTDHARRMAEEARSLYLRDSHVGPTIPESAHIVRAMEPPSADSRTTFAEKYGPAQRDVRRLVERFEGFLHAIRA